MVFFNVNMKSEKNANIYGFKVCLYEIHIIRLHFNLAIITYHKKKKEIQTK